jgi:hypothetical protein
LNLKATLGRPNHLSWNGLINSVMIIALSIVILAVADLLAGRVPAAAAGDRQRPDIPGGVDLERLPRSADHPRSGRRHP